MAESLLDAWGAEENSGLPVESVSESLRFDVGDAAAPCTPSGATTEDASLGDAILTGKRKREEDSPSNAENFGARKSSPADWSIWSNKMSSEKMSVLIGSLGYQGWEFTRYQGLF